MISRREGDKSTQSFRHQCLRKSCDFKNSFLSIIIISVEIFYTENDTKEDALTLNSKALHELNCILLWLRKALLLPPLWVFIALKYTSSDNLLYKVFLSKKC